MIFRRSPHLIDCNATSLLLVDVQERLFGHIHNADQIALKLEALIKAFDLLDLPKALTEQVPDKLGRTVENLAEFFGPKFVKSMFSCREVFPALAECLSWKTDSRTDRRSTVVVVGIEAHVCVLQTVLDLQANGLQVVVPIDAIGSQQEIDCNAAIDRMTKNGCVMTTTESLLFELIESSKHAKFRDVSRIAKQFHGK